MMDFIAAGNTQPGGFYRGAGDARGEVRAAENSGLRSAGFGEGTMKLFRGFVEETTSRGPAAPPQPNGRVPLSTRPSHQPRAHQAYAEPTPSWNVTDDMMHQP